MRLLLARFQSGNRFELNRWIYDWDWIRPLMRQSKLLLAYYRKGEGETQLFGYTELFDLGD
jgi:hypothetical protein